MPADSAGYLSTRALAKELVRRGPRILRRVAHPRRARVGIRTSFAPPSRESIGVFAREGRPPAQLLSGYRDHVKSGWRLYFWQVAVLFKLESRLELPPDLARLAQEIRRSRTLPVQAAEIGAALEQLRERHPEHLVATGVRDELNGQEKLAVLHTRADMVPVADYYRDTAAQAAGQLRAHGIRLEGARGVELGCGTGYLLHALAALGPRELVGIDLGLDGYLDASRERPLMRDLLASEKSGTVELISARAESLPFEDGSFDFSVSVGAIEHFQDLGSVFREQARVLRPGGVGYHTIGPWFSPGGGHSLCTLDFPWGHVRLTPDEFGRYVEEHRPHEAPEALDNYRTGYHDPRLTLAETERLVVEAGLELLHWHDGSDFGAHLAYIDRALLADCRERRPDVSIRDLITNNYIVVFRRTSA